MSDNYEFMKAHEPQDVGDYSPYIDKKYKKIIMIIIMVLYYFDLEQMYNSQKFTETGDVCVCVSVCLCVCVSVCVCVCVYAVLPITMVAAFYLEIY